MIKTPKLFLFFLFILSNHHSIGQIDFGVQLEIGTSQLMGISQEEIVTHGLSGADAVPKNRLFLSPTFVTRKTFFNHLILEAGIGYLPLRCDIQLGYYYRLPQLQVDTSLLIKLHYFKAPINIGFSLPIKSNTSLNIYAGLTYHYLMHSYENFDKIIFEEIWFIKRDWYTHESFFLPNAALSVQYDTKHLGKFELGAFINGMKRGFTKEGRVWGFYKNLIHVDSFEYGVRLNYFFSMP